MNEQFTLWMPVTKTASGSYSAILSDNSIDRDEEIMDSNLVKSWAKNNTLPALINHENKMEKWVGGWKNMSTISKGIHTALVAEPFFFSAKANPIAEQVKNQIEEALTAGLSPGVSITAIPKKSENREINGKMYKVYTEAELLEATWVPLQSNRNAYAFVAKQFDIEDSKQIIEENKMTEEIKSEVIIETKEVDMKLSIEKEVTEKLNAEFSKKVAEHEDVVKKLKEEIEALNKKLVEAELLSKAPFADKAVVENQTVTKEKELEEFYNKYKAK